VPRRHEPNRSAIIATAVAAYLAIAGIAVVDPILPAIGEAIGVTPWQVELLFTAYIAVMAATSQLGRIVAERQAVAQGLGPSLRVMVAPEPLNPFRRTVVRDLGPSYETGALTWWVTPRYAASGERVAALVDTAAQYRLAASTRAGRHFLVWSRFPFYEELPAGAATAMRLDDVRYGGPGRASFASVMIPAARTQ